MKKPSFLKKKRILGALGYDMEHWVRVVENRAKTAYLDGLDVASLDALEISGEGNSAWPRKYAFKSYVDLSYPDYDICEGPVEGRSFDIIIADHVLPHVAWPFRMVRNAKAMLRPGGHFLLSSSFLIYANQRPLDCTRWTSAGLKHLLMECGFEETAITVDSWGNYDCAVANLKRLGTKMGWGRSLENDPRYPVTSWAFARG